MFGDEYLKTVESVYKALHFADEEIGKGGIVKKEWLEGLIGKSKKEELALKELAIISRAKKHVDFLEKSLRNIHNGKSGKVRYIVPTFQTNACMDVCKECGWNRDNKTKRIMLKPAEFEVQLDVLKKAGFGVIEISNGTVPTMLEWDSFKDYMEIVKRN